MLKQLSLTLLAISIPASSLGQTTNPRPAGDAQYDWLESARNPEALKWAAERTSDAYRRLLAGPEATQVLQEVKTISNSASSPPPFVEPYSVLGDTIARFVINGEHPAGLIQTAPLGPRGVGKWRTVLDVDALNAREGKNYGLPVLKLTSTCLPPEYRRCLIPLGINGSEIAQYWEFDLKTGQFLDDGFRFAPAKTEVAWMDKDTLLVAQAVPGETLQSSFPSKVRLWKRGTPYADAKIVFTAKPSDSFFRLNAIGTGNSRKGAIFVSENGETGPDLSYVVSLDGTVTPTGLPTGTPYPGNLGLSGGTGRYIVTAINRPTTFMGRDYPEGSVFAYDTDAATPKDKRISLVYSSPKDAYLYDAQFGITFSKSHVYMVSSHDLGRTLLVATRGSKDWTVRKLLDVAPGDAITLWGGNTTSNAVVMAREGYLAPQSLALVEGEHCCTPLFTKPAVFDATKFVTEIRMAKAHDGTLVPYYLVRPRSPKAGPVPTILSAYGGGGAVVDPAYATKWLDGGLVSWLNRGGAYAYAAIRGGGEKGYAWHEGGAMHNKPQGLDDVAAVAEDLIGRGFTTREHLGLTGRSYGGLMASSVAVRHPDLFGAVLVGVPVADLFPLKDSAGMLSILKGELGDPNNPADRAVMLSYSAIENIRPGVKYPPVLTVASTSDDRVGPGPARRFTAKLEANGADAMLIEGANGGHLFPKAASEPKAVTAEVMFFIDNLMR